MILSTVALWALLAVGFLVLEACTVAMVSLWFAIGAAAALVLSCLGRRSGSRRRRSWWSPECCWHCCGP